MDLSLSDEQRVIRDTFHRFAAQEIRPVADQLDEAPDFPRELFTKVGALGFYGMRYPEPEGSGADILSYLLAIEELAWGSLSVAAACAMQSLMGTWFLHRFTEGALRERLFLPALTGDAIGAICMTEPDAGSDLMAVTTRAEARGDRWLISGAKTWVTSAPVADFFTVLARTGDTELSFFLVERGADGLTVGRSIDKMGVRASLTSEVGFEETPATCVLGDPGQGASCLRDVLAEIRLLTAALALGVGRAAFEDARAYADERRQFDRPLRKFQAIQAHLAEMAVDLEAARRMTWWAAWRGEQGGGSAQEASMAKLHASEAALRICDRAARIFASYGYARDYPIERYLRDVRFTLIGGGTSEILRVNIARGLY
ncbi:MAG: acyl-CoA dehydrogenase family protein [Vicinamibacterales bacterium]|jgi:butyryl-CoA dehydrogenase|nr:acyl-CoA dehydrogenase [Acidobacteriota bacterium]MDP7473181.1 acyl-CoA dehydrogenase family protein [Vicinamibacterales bacterium]MDP7670550.1 acyl-CoA dehydrogenase family protein [Vicinamibacterales bacterium]HJO38207.1 acyl-CoA dehydrogenase family protein [Vicinamibacterales bacterium]|tara:strand:- start:2971 stop:4086 length:1116 start_codon:yes stop_codon:yes gene_type:complete